jgi:hypothetical protein
MRDSELRGLVLQKFYDQRHRGILQLPHIVSAYPSEPLLVLNICDQLAQAGLIEWKSSKSFSAIGGIGKITGRGVDVIEGGHGAPIAVTLPAHGNRSNAQAASPDAQNIKIDADKAIAAIDRCDASDAEKSAAKSMIERLAANPCAWSALRSALGGPADR